MGQCIVPLDLLDTSPVAKVGPNPRLASGIAPTSFYLSRFALVLTTHMFCKMTWCAVEGHGELRGLQYLTNLIAQRNFAAVDFPRLLSYRAVLTRQFSLRHELP